MMENIGLGIFSGSMCKEEAIKKFTEDAMKIAELEGKAELRLKRALELVDLEEQGRLVVLPCKVGDTVWVLKGDPMPNGYETLTPTHAEKCKYGFTFSMLDKDGKLARPWVISREEAEAALKE